MGQKTPPMTTILRAFEIIDVLWRLKGAGPSTLGEKLGLSKSTAHVYLRTLQSTGYVVNDGGEYHLSYRFLTMGSRLRYRSRIFQVAESEIETLARETGELVTLVVRENDESVILHLEKGDRALELGLYPGMMIPLHSHASGKVLLAQMSPERVATFVSRRGLDPVTDETITDPDELRAELDVVRERGYAYDWDQQVKGMGVIGAPIVVEDSLEGVLSIACPTGRLKRDSYREELLQEVQQSIERISIKHKYGN